MDQFRQIELFVQIADSGSISKAAEALQLSVSAASRILFQLEKRLGVRLVQRTTRQLFLTEAGSEYRRRCKSILADMREADASVQDIVVKPSGLLRVTASLSFCLLHIEPMLSSFSARYPDITIDIVAANRYLDIIDNNVDVAIRTRQFEADRALTIRKLAKTRRVLAASPQYLEAYGTPKEPADLAGHKMLIYDYALNPNELSFKKNEESATIHVTPFLSTNDGQVVVKAALDHIGVLVQPKYIIYDDLASGKLVSVLDDWHLPMLTMNIAFQTRAFMPAKVRVFVEALVERFKSNDYNNLWSS
ncbi:LysR family transcriptional regulator (plasmid) [Azospirillum oryzae]|uniref:LysR family transcriptional regulator n=1 Tax=Azospirillum oryzae TaxID=286727 RepID=A0A6N1AT98_9PROT|nr:LysR family transcriptional regulator [Azospirillum oryzae]KAA0585424.1 LysR family transcriptional regulator [Azospirillum oryzae]QKS54579.1 LysR family transcriptional regulator [Azospirillum oryzae]